MIVSISYQLLNHFLIGSEIHYNIFRDPSFSMWFILALVFYRLTTKLVIRIPYYLSVVVLISIFATYLPNIILKNFDFLRIFSFMIYYFIGFKLREQEVDCRKFILKKQYVICIAVFSLLLISYLSTFAYSAIVDVLKQTDVSFFTIYLLLTWYL